MKYFTLFVMSALCWMEFVQGMGVSYVPGYLTFSWKLQVFISMHIAMIWWYMIIVGGMGFSTIFESAGMAIAQMSNAPSKAGFKGFMQFLADGVKLFFKEWMIVGFIKTRVHHLVGLYAYIFTVTVFFILPVCWEYAVCYLEYSIFFAFFASLSHVFCMILAGWSSSSKYAFLGALSSGAQLVAYEMVSISVYLNLYIWYQGFNYNDSMVYELSVFIGSIILPVQFIIYFMAALAETNSHPFDLPEAEAELVAGYFVEYSSMRFAFFFLAEYASMLFTAMSMNHLFFGATISFFHFVEWVISVAFIMYVMMKVSAMIPSYSYDQLMRVCWKKFLVVQIAMLNVYMMIQSLLHAF